MYLTLRNNDEDMDAKYQLIINVIITIVIIILLCSPAYRPSIAITVVCNLAVCQLSRVV